jgi:hypothetical protein
MTRIKANSGRRTICQWTNSSVKPGSARLVRYSPTTETRQYGEALSFKQSLCRAACFVTVRRSPDRPAAPQYGPEGDPCRLGSYTEQRCHIWNSILNHWQAHFPLICSQCRRVSHCRRQAITLPGWPYLYLALFFLIRPYFDQFQVSIFWTETFLYVLTFIWTNKTQNFQRVPCLSLVLVWFGETKHIWETI